MLLNILPEEGRLLDLPALVITAPGTSNNVIDAIQLGAYDFVTRPFDLDDVIATIRVHNSLTEVGRCQDSLLQESDSFEKTADPEMAAILAPLNKLKRFLDRLARSAFAARRSDLHVLHCCFRFRLSRYTRILAVLTG
jgi:DNA-binding NtrC family response regulator